MVRSGGGGGGGGGLRCMTLAFSMANWKGSRRFVSSFQPVMLISLS